MDEWMDGIVPHPLGARVAKPSTIGGHCCEAANGGRLIAIIGEYQEANNMVRRQVVEKQETHIAAREALGRSPFLPNQFAKIMSYGELPCFVHNYCNTVL
jgi:hypothetical protein